MARARAMAAAGMALVAVAAKGAFGPRYGGEARVVVRSLPATFTGDPTHGVAARLVSSLVHETLVDVDADGRPAPALLEGWSESADGREWTLRLRPSAVFHEGSEISAEAVVRSLRGFLRSPPAAAARLAAALDGGTAYRARASEALPGLAAGEGTVTLRLRAPSAMLLPTLAARSAAITGPRGAGAGPFVPTTPAPILGRARFAAFARHVRGRPFLDSVSVEAAPGPAAHATPVLADGPRAATLLLALDPRIGPFIRAEDRRRVAALFDRADLVRHFLPGAVAAGALAPPALLAPAHAVPLVRVERLAFAGVIPLAISTDVPEDVSRRVVAYLGAGGIRALARPADPEAVWTAPASARLVLFVPDAADPVLALDELAALAPAADTPAARALRDAAAAEMDRDRRADLARRADAALRESGLIVALAAVPLGVRAGAGLQAVRLDARGTARLEDAWREP